MSRRAANPEQPDPGAARSTPSRPRRGAWTREDAGRNTETRRTRRGTEAYGNRLDTVSVDGALPQPMIWDGYGEVVERWDGTTFDRYPDGSELTITNPDTTVLADIVRDAFGRPVQVDDGDVAPTIQLWGNPGSELPLGGIGADGAPFANVTAEGELLGEVHGGFLQLAATDARGNLAATGAGELLDLPGAFGEDAELPVTSSNRYVWGGQATLGESSLRLARHRTYDADLGRWMSADPIGLQGGEHRFNYVGNDPLAFVDPSGLFQMPGTETPDGTADTSILTNPAKWHTLYGTDEPAGDDSGSGGDAIDAGGAGEPVSTEGQRGVEGSKDTAVDASASADASLADAPETWTKAAWGFFFSTRPDDVPDASQFADNTDIGGAPSGPEGDVATGDVEFGDTSDLSDVSTAASGPTGGGGSVEDRLPRSGPTGGVDQPSPGVMARVTIAGPGARSEELVTVTPSPAASESGWSWNPMTYYRAWRNGLANSVAEEEVQTATRLQRGAFSGADQLAELDDDPVDHDRVEEGADRTRDLVNETVDQAAMWSAAELAGVAGGAIVGGVGRVGAPAEGGLTILGSTHSGVELGAASEVARLGRNVVMRDPSGIRSAAGATADLLVDGVPMDIYSPNGGTSVNNIFRMMASKNDQARGIVLDLSMWDGTVSELGDIAGRLRGKLIAQGSEVNIQEVIVVGR